MSEKEQYNWQYENSINSGKTPIDMDSPQEFKYSQWRTNKSLSNHSDTIFYANQMNMNYHIKDKMHYLYLFYSIRKQRRYGAKKTEEDKRLEKEAKATEAKLKLVQEKYKYNNKRAKEALTILTSKQLDMIAKEQEKGG
mgnify:FL=1